MMGDLNSGGAMPSARAATPSGRSRLRVSGIACIAIALAGCANYGTQESYRAAMRECLERIPKGPERTKYNDWDEVVNACEGYASRSTLYPTQGTSGSAQDPQGLGPKGAGPVGAADAPEGTSHD